MDGGNRMATAHDGLTALEDQLRDSAPPGVAALPGEHLYHLADAIRAARRREAVELAAAGEQAFNMIPRLLRGPIRRLLG